MSSYKYKDKKYTIQSKAKYKNPATRKWIDVITYTSFDNPCQIYVREKEEFLERFEAWDPGMDK